MYNTGPDAAEMVLVQDLWPSGLIFVESTPNYVSFIPPVYMWSLGTIGHNENKTINITAIVNATGLITNFVNVTTTTFDPHPDNNATANVTVQPAAHVVLNKTVSNSTPNYWSTVTWFIEAYNTGPNIAEGVQVTDILPAGLTYISSSPSQGSYDPGTGIWNIGQILNGTSKFLNITANVTGTGNITNWANVTNQTTFDNQTWSKDNETIQVGPASIFTLHKEWRAMQDGPPITTAEYLDNVWIIFSATSLGPDEALIRLDDTLPAGFAPGNYWQWKVDSGSWINMTSTWPGFVNSDFPVGSTLWVSIPGQITVANTTLNNIVIQTTQSTFNPQYPQGGPYGNASAQLNIPPHSHIVVTKTVNNSRPNFGDTIIFTVTAHNNGPNDATGVQVIDILPVELIFVSSNPSLPTYDPSSGIWNIGTLLNGTSKTLNITAKVNGTGTIINYANEANATINVPPAASLVITKTATPPILTVGQPVTFTITVKNNGPDTSIGTFVTDKLPSGLTFQSSNPSPPIYDPSSGIWTIGNLPSGSSAILTITALVAQQGSYTNTATVGGETFNPNTGNNTTTATVVGEVPGIPSAEAAGKTIPLQKTGLPVAYIALAVLMLLAGYIVPKRK